MGVTTISTNFGYCQRYYPSIIPHFINPFNTKTYRDKINKILIQNRVKPTIRLQPRLRFTLSHVKKFSKKHKTFPNRNKNNPPLIRGGLFWANLFISRYLETHTARHCRSPCSATAMTFFLRSFGNHSLGSD